MIVYGVKDSESNLFAVILAGYADIDSDKELQIYADNEEMYLYSIREELTRPHLDWYPTIEEAIQDFFIENRDVSKYIKD